MHEYGGAAGSVNDRYLTHIEILTIIYLTRQPEGRCKLPVPANNKAKNNRSILYQGAGRLFFMYLIYECYDTRYHHNEGKEVTPSNIHKHHPFSARVGTGRAVLPAALISILLSMCGCESSSNFRVCFILSQIQGHVYY